MSLIYYIRLKTTIPNDWEILPLSEILLEAKPGYASGKRKDDGTPQLRVNNIRTDGQLNLSEILRVPSNPQEKDYYLRKGDILVNNTNSVDLVGKTAIVRENIEGYTYSNHITRLRVNTDFVSSEWVHYQLMRFWQLGQFKNICVRHVCQAGIRTNELLEQRIPVASIEEQGFISEALDNVQYSINCTKEIIEAYSIIKKGVMQRLLTRGIGHTKFKKTKIGEIPEAWEVVKLEDIFALSYGKGLKGAERKTQGKYPVYGSNGIIGYIDECLVPYETLIIGRKGACGVVHLTESGSWPIDTTFYVSDLDESRVDIDFLHYSLQFARLSRYTIVTAVPGVNRLTILGHRIALPLLNEQRKIASILSLVSSEISNDEEMIRNLEMLKKGLMQVLLSGKARVKP